MTQLKPYFENIRAHYDVSNEFYELFLDETMTYSCGIYASEKTTAEEAQYAKIDSAIALADVRPGQTVLDIGFGWGSVVRRLAEQHGCHVIGLTLSNEQHAHVLRQLEKQPLKRGSCDLRIQGWEEFHEPVDRIISVEVFEHFGEARYDPFFQRCRELLPADGRMFLQTSLMYRWQYLQKMNIPIDHESILFAKFMGREIFPGGFLCEPQTVIRHAEKNGFDMVETRSLREHYPRTLDYWAARLEANRSRAIELTSAAVVDRYLKYFTGCSKYFTSGHIDVWQYAMKPTLG